MNESKRRDPRCWEIWRRSGAIGTVPATRPASTIIKGLMPKVKYNEFLYPTSRQFPFDEVCEQIVRELEKRNWNVPGITVEFHDYGSGEQKFRNVNYIKGRDFKLWFCRKQRTMPGKSWNDCSAVTEIVIPKKELHVYEDESGPSFYLYVGNNWEKDRESFMNGGKVNSKLDGKPRTYLKYKGSESLSRRYHYAGARPTFLVHDNDLDREYSPKWSEPKSFNTKDVMAEFKTYLETVVLKMVVSQPIQKKMDMCVAPDSVPFPWLVLPGELFTFGEWDDEARIKKGKTDPSQLNPAERYGMIGSGYRLLSLGTKNDGTIPEIAYEGFLWCGIAPSIVQVPIEALDIPGHHRWSDREKYVIKLKPKSANDIYVADHALYEKRREEIGNSIGDRDRFTDAEVDDMKRARARSIIPISEYRGGYEQPVVLVNRELDFDEIEAISGPHSRSRVLVA